VNSWTALPAVPDDSVAETVSDDWEAAMTSLLLQAVREKAKTSMKIVSIVRKRRYPAFVRRDFRDKSCILMPPL
jgi:hypothetical protein